MSSTQKIILSASRDIPFNKLVLSQANVRRVKAGLSIEQLADDIAHRTLLQSLSVRPVLDTDGQETGVFEVPAGGRRFRALELLVKQKRMAKTQPIPCVVRLGGMAEEDSLAENVQRVALHPLDQFRAFQALRDNGLGEEEIAARFFVSATVVKQRLRLAGVSPKLLDIYAEDGMSLEQLMAFTVTTDPARQEQIWEALAQSYNREPYTIRRLLTERAVPASDRRARFIGIEAYEAEGGMVLNDLFQRDNGGWLQDPVLLDRLVTQKLHAEAQRQKEFGWLWVMVAAQFPYGHTAGMRRLTGSQTPISEAEQTALSALTVEYEALVAACERSDAYSEDAETRLCDLERQIQALEDRPVSFEPAEMAISGMFISIDEGGSLQVEPGYVRPEDEDTAPDETAASPRATSSGSDAAAANADSGEDDAPRPLSERLVTELTVQRTVALRDAVAKAPEVAFVAVLHALCLETFYPHSTNSCLEITAKQVSFPAQPVGLAEMPAAKGIDARHDFWANQMPETPDRLWETLTALDSESRMALLAHCASLTINVVKESWNRRPGALAHGDRLARAVSFDMASSGWSATAENYFGRVPKTRILEAVREAKGEAASGLIDHLKKPDMAKEAERLIDGTGWLPEPLRIPRLDTEAAALPDFLNLDENDPEATAELHGVAAA